MAPKGHTCPACGSEKVTTIRLPRIVEHGEKPGTQPGFRCLKCDTQWTHADRARTTPDS